MFVEICVVSHVLSHTHTKYTKCANVVSRELLFLGQSRPSNTCMIQLRPKVGEDAKSSLAEMHIAEKITLSIGNQSAAKPEVRCWKPLCNRSP